MLTRGQSTKVAGKKIFGDQRFNFAVRQKK